MISYSSLVHVRHYRPLITTDALPVKTMKLLAIISFLPSLCLSYAVYVQWNVNNIPNGGLRNISFPMLLAQSPHATGWHFAQQFQFIGNNQVGYIGMQPRPDSAGRPILHAVFSSFIAGSTENDANCSPGADGGPGVSCGVDFSGSYGDTYNLEVVNTGGTTWAGTVVNTATGNRIHIGTWTLPVGTQGIMNSQAGFIEYYPWNAGGHRACNTLPRTAIALGFPSTLGSIGNLTNAFESPSQGCFTRVALRSVRTASAVQIQLGF
jgi:hypothetical protein